MYPFSKRDGRIDIPSLIIVSIKRKKKFFFGWASVCGNQLVVCFCREFQKQQKTVRKILRKNYSSSHEILLQILLQISYINKPNSE